MQAEAHYCPQSWEKPNVFVGRYHEHSSHEIFPVRKPVHVAEDVALKFCIFRAS